MCRNMEGGLHMNVPNKLTLLRVLLIPLFVIAMMVPMFAGQEWLALAIFVAAAVTDILDGQIARRCNLITDFGKFMDPLADKLLVCAALVCLVELGRVPGWMVIVIISREFAISGFRLIAANKGTVIAAGWLGKIKTVLQMVAIGMLIPNLPALSVITTIVLWAAVIMTIVSLIDYIVRNREVIRDM